MKRLTRGEAIRRFCYECAGGNHAEVTKCPAVTCPLWRYRKGTEIEPKISDKEGIFDAENDF